MRAGSDLKMDMTNGLIVKMSSFNLHKIELRSIRKMFSCDRKRFKNITYHTYICLCIFRSICQSQRGWFSRRCSRPATRPCASVIDPILFLTLKIFFNVKVTIFIYLSNQDDGWRVVHCARLLASGWHQEMMTASKEIGSIPWRPPPSD